MRFIYHSYTKTSVAVISPMREEIIEIAISAVACSY